MTGISTTSGGLAAVVEQVGHVAVHQAAVVGEAALGQQCGCVVVQLPERGPIPDGPGTGDRIKGVDGAVDDSGLVDGGDPDRGLVQVAVMATLVAGVDDAADDVGIALGGVAGHEEGRAYIAAVSMASSRGTPVSGPYAWCVITDMRAAALRSIAKIADSASTSKVSAAAL